MLAYFTSVVYMYVCKGKILKHETKRTYM